MQPDKVTFLYSARREMLLAAEELQANIRGVSLSRGAQVLERLAFYENALAPLLEPVIVNLAGFASRLRHMLGLPTVAQRELTGSASENYDTLNRLIEGLLHELGKEPWVNQPEVVIQIDDIVAGVSRVCYELTSAIASQAAETARSWEAGRPTCRHWPVTEAILSDYLRQRFGNNQAIHVTNLEKLQGLNANEAYFLKVEGVPGWPRDVILRRQIPVQIQPTAITEEFDVLNSVYEHLPVPRPLLAEDDKQILGQPFIMLQRLNAELKPLPEMAEQGRAGFLKLAASMAELHRLDPAILPVYRRAADGDNHAWLKRRIDVYEQEWRRGAKEPVHTVTAAFHWLRRHSGDFLSQQVIVHGDLDHRNVLFDDNLDIVALIDWEVCHQGHPAEDLAYCRESVEKVMPWQDFLSAYLGNGGAPVSQEDMRYAKVLSNLLRVTTSMIAHSAYVEGELDNFLMGSVRTIETEMACQYLHEAIYGD